MAETLQFSVDLPVSTERVYRAWLDTHEHSQFTGSPAKINPVEGGKYTAFDGYISGQTLSLVPFNRIVQTYRTTDTAPNSPDMQIELEFEPTCLGSQMILTHTGIPNGKSSAYLKDWEDRYLRPLAQYFDELVGDTVIDMDG